jgi:16S rRNA (guanine966-N2)-methyltransferase
MRIIAGSHRGRPLESPADQRIRPTSDRIRESLFSVLDHRLGGFAGLRVLDGFAGSGALGLEALSRGAAAADFMDSDRAALALCRKNATKLGLADRAAFHLADTMRPPRAAAPCDLVFLDPPYGNGFAAVATQALDAAGWLRQGALLVVEADRAQPEPTPPGFEIADQRDYGRTRIAFVIQVGTI